MMHHKPEDWLLFMDGEAPAELARNLSLHLASCPQCAAELEGWKRSAQKLRRLPFPARQRSRPRKIAGLEIGLAAAIALLLGVAIGRLTGPNEDRLRQSITTELARAMNHQIHEEIGQAVMNMERERRTDQRQFIEAINGVRGQDVADCVALRQDLETAVSAADSGLQVNSRRITELAGVMSNSQP